MRHKPSTVKSLETIAEAGGHLGLRSPWVQLPLGFSSVEELFGRAHNVKLCSDKSPVDLYEWGFERPPLKDVAAHVEQGGLFGSVPFTMTLPGGLHLSALDVDYGDVSTLTAAYPPLVALRSWQEGRAHCYFVDSEPRTNAAWAYGDAGGEVRSANGYLAHYRTGPQELAQAASEWPRGPRCVPFPAHLQRSTSTGHGSKLRLSGSTAPRIACPVGLKPLARLRDVAVGQRHPAMVREASRWAGTKTWNGQALDDAGLVRCLWRLAIGMTHRLPEQEVALIVGWAVSMRPIFWAMPHTPGWVARQAVRGRHGGTQSGIVRRAGSNEERRPWDDEGCSRRTWYRRNAVMVGRP